MTGSRTLAETPAAGPVPSLELAEWQQAYGVVAGITTRAHGFDLGLFGPGEQGTVLAHWAVFDESVRRRFPSVRIGHQVHGCAIQVYGQSAPGRHLAEGVDGHVTSSPGILLAVTVADCVPVYLLHPPSGTLALLHAGWRGTAAGMLEAGVSALMAKASGQTSEIVMHCGIAICGGCYEVGPEVAEALSGHHTRGKQTVDLRANLLDRAERLGLRDMTSSPWCTAHDNDRFYSHRASAGKDGRMVAFLGRPAL